MLFGERVSLASRMKDQLYDLFLDAVNLAFYDLKQQFLFLRVKDLVHDFFLETVDFTFIELLK